MKRSRGSPGALLVLQGLSCLSWSSPGSRGALVALLGLSWFSSGSPGSPRALLGLSWGLGSVCLYLCLSVGGFPSTIGPIGWPSHSGNEVPHRFRPIVEAKPCDGTQRAIWREEWRVGNGVSV